MGFDTLFEYFLKNFLNKKQIKNAATKAIIEFIGVKILTNPFVLFKASIPFITFKALSKFSALKNIRVKLT